jgi:hypothetical protein
VHVQVNVCGASSGTDTAVNCCTRFCPTFTVVGVTTTVSGITFKSREPVVEVPVNVAVMVTEMGVAGAT